MVLHIGHVDETLAKVFGSHWRSLLDTRTLQSMALFMKLPLDVTKKSKHYLALDIGMYLFNNPLYIQSFAHELIRIANSAKLKTSIFDFLCDGYGDKLLVSKINEFSIFGEPVYDNYFHGECDRRIILNYLSDVCDVSVMNQSLRLDSLKNNIDSMAYFKKRFSWFRAGDGCEHDAKLQAAIDFFGKNPVPSFAIQDIDALELYFFNTFIDVNRKRIVFKDICSLYANRKSRRKSDKKQCNFSIEEKTIEYIDSFSKDNKISRSELLEIIFKPKNTQALLLLLKG
ncbi:hypothetical protein [uncultured Comamonas sp.]|uniref:hypothetical protein n=1 Tax=uncultured Comamonas sp. TaxID=114710 RepID=UPI003749D2DE